MPALTTPASCLETRTHKGNIMNGLSLHHRFKPALLACAAGVYLFATPAFAQAVDPNRLLEIMVTKGLVTRAEADIMIAEARTAPPQQSAAAPVGGVSGDVQTIPYIPETVRKQIKEELRTELASQAQAQGWAAPGEVAEWTKRITISGDIRVRGEGVRFDKPRFDAAGLQTSGNYRDFPDFEAINAGGAFNENDKSPGYVLPPYLNSEKNRYRARIRARLGVNARIDDWISGEIRLSTGADHAPVSTNQTMGQGSNFGKYSIWLDRANIRLNPVKGVDLAFGRFANPFWTSELLFDEDLNFDGIAASAKIAVSDRGSVFGTLGAFPVFNTSFNFGSSERGAFASKDKYLLAGQLGAEISPVDHVTLKAAVGYFRFEKVAGELSSPCNFYQDVCNTDATRPAFQQFGNSLRPIRSIVIDPAAPNGTSPMPQYYGLSSEFEVLNAHAALDLSFFDPIGIRIEGDFVKNLAFNRARVAAVSINPSSFGPGGTFVGGDKGWQASLLVGAPDLLSQGDWHVQIGYRRLEADAVLDAFADSDFHFGGTNAKGFILGGGYAIGKNTQFGARWLSADAVSGPTYSNDVFQFDLTTRF